MRFEKVSLDAFMREYKKCGFKEGYLTAYKNIKIPERQTKESCGYDFVTPIDFDLHPNRRIVIPTGIKCNMEDSSCWCLQLYVRSSVGIKMGIVMSNGTGIIDRDYYNNKNNEGNILIPLWNTSDQYHHFKAGERLVQGVLTTYGITEDDNVTGIRTGGVGSTNGK